MPHEIESINEETEKLYIYLCIYSYTSTALSIHKRKFWS